MYRISPSARLSRVGWNHVVKVLMLTRALTWSRNWSQGFPASRSRPTWVAVVIAKDKTKPLGYFHRMCKTCGKQFLAYSSSGFGIPGRGGYLMPLGSVCDLLGFAGPPTKSHTDPDRKSTRLNSSHRCISYAVFCLK